MTTSEGAQLDMIGEIVERQRYGMADELYKVWLKAAIATNTSEGDIERVISLWRLFVPTATVVHVTEVFPAGVLLVSNVPPDPTYETQIVSCMQSAVCAGVKFDYEFIYNPDYAFQFDGGACLGFGDALNHNIGGQFFSLT